MIQRTHARPLPLIVAGTAILCAHLLLNVLLPRQAQSISYAFFLLVSLIAVVACGLRVRRASPAMRINWLLVSIAILFWFTAIIVEAITQYFFNVPSSIASPDSFFYFFFCIPLLLAVCAPVSRQVTRLFFVLDILQAVAAGYLAYLAIFSVLPFSLQPLRPVSVSNLVWIFDLEHAGLSLLALIRIVVGRRGTVEHRFSVILAMFLWTYTATAFWYNHAVGVVNGASPFDFLLDIPFLALAFCAVRFATPMPRLTVQRESQRPLYIFLDNARPIGLGIVIVALSAWVAQGHPRVATGFIAGAFLLYGARSVLLQNRFLQTESALGMARDRLEELVLQDGLTGIANRRCFDQRLEHEWSRAHRNRRPLSMLIIDVDYFKQVNDMHGHVIGDECLKHIAQTLRSVPHRAGDLVARYGGEEFAVLLPETNASGAVTVAGFMREKLAASNPSPAICVCPVTISIGVSTWEACDDALPGHLLDTTDKALYTAKQNGRDRIEFLEMPLLVAQ